MRDVDHIDKLIRDVYELRTQLAAAERRAGEAEAERDACSNRLYGVKHLTEEAAKALKSAHDAINREAWQDGPSILRACEELGNAAGNIKDFGIDGYDGRVRLAQSVAVKAMKERDQLRTDNALLAAECRAIRLPCACSENQRRCKSCVQVKRASAALDASGALGRAQETP